MTHEAVPDAPPPNPPDGPVPDGVAPDGVAPDGVAPVRLFGRRPARPAALTAAMRSDQGRVRAMNQDACLVDTELGLFAVADGMGGQPAGDVAARLAIEHLPALVRAALAGPAARGGQTTGEAVGRAVVNLHRVVLAEATTGEGLAGMGTTLVLALVTGTTAYVAHVGDSRCYLLRGVALRRMTEDHSLASTLVDRGVVDAEDAGRLPFAHSLTQAIGLPETPRPSVIAFDLEPGDRLLLCSDGLTRMVTEQRIGELLGAGHDTDATCQALVDEANGAGGLDNVSVVLVDSP